MASLNCKYHTLCLFNLIDKLRVACIWSKFPRKGPECRGDNQWNCHHTGTDETSQYRQILQNFSSRWATDKSFIFYRSILSFLVWKNMLFFAIISFSFQKYSFDKNKNLLVHVHVFRISKSFIVFTLFFSEQKLYIVMELIEGAPIGEHFNSLKEKNMKFPEDRIWNIFMQVGGKKMQ